MALLQLAGVLETSLHPCLCLVERLTFFACSRHCDCPPARDRCRRTRARVLAELRPLLRGGLAFPLVREPARGRLLWNPASADARRLVENACQVRLGRWSREVLLLTGPGCISCPATWLRSRVRGEPWLSSTAPLSLPGTLPPLGPPTRGHAASTSLQSPMTLCWRCSSFKKLRTRRR